MSEIIIQNILTLVFSAVGAGLTIAYRSLSKRLKTQEHVRDGIVTVLHHMLYDACKHHLKKGYLADAEEMEEIAYIYRAYAALGGNGTGKELYERTMKLEIREEQ